jgi:hypothetical protein
MWRLVRDVWVAETDEEAFKATREQQEKECYSERGMNISTLSLTTVLFHF